MEFLRFSVKESSTFQGTILFRFRGEKGECVTSYAVEIDPERVVTTEKDADVTKRSITCEVSLSEDDFLWIYSGKASSSDIAKLFYQGRLSISGYAFRKVSNFAQSFDFSSEKWRQFYSWKDAWENQQRSPSSKEEVMNIGSPSRDFWFHNCRSILVHYKVSRLQRLQWEASLASIFGERYVLRAVHQTTVCPKSALLDACDQAAGEKANDLLIAVSNVVGMPFGNQSARKRALSWSDARSACPTYNVDDELQRLLHPIGSSATTNVNEVCAIGKAQDIVQMLDGIDSKYVEAVKHSAKQRFHLHQRKNRVDVTDAGLTQLDRLLTALGKELQLHQTRPTKPKYIPGPELLLREFNSHAMEVVDLLKEKALGRKAVNRIPVPDLDGILGDRAGFLVVDATREEDASLLDMTPAVTITPRSSVNGGGGMIVKVNRANIQRRGSKRDLEIPTEKLKQKLSMLQRGIVARNVRYSSQSIDDHLVFSDYL